jgi:hypothetical protein
MVIEFTIEILSGETAGQKLRLNQRRITLGRHPQLNDVILPQSTISSRHASITYSQGQYLLEDLGSTNKTFVNGRGLKPGETIALHDGMSFRLGQMHLRFRENLLSEATTPEVESEAGTPSVPATVSVPERVKAFMRWRLPQGRRSRLILSAGALVVLLFGLSVTKWVLGDGSTAARIAPPTAGEDLSQVPITLPATGVYGLTKQRDRRHPDKVIFDFESDTTRVVLLYTPGGIDDAAEVEIRLNGEVLGHAAVAEKWGSIQELPLPRRLLSKGQKNRIEFDNLRNPPGQETWAVRDVSVRLLPEIACNTSEGERLLALGRERYEEKAVDEGNLFRAMTYFERAAQVGETCSPQPRFLGEAQTLFEHSHSELEAAYNGLLFAYKKALKLKDYQQTKTHLEAITRLIGDAQDLRFKKAQRLLTRLNQALAHQRP